MLHPLYQYKYLCLLLFYILHSDLQVQIQSATDFMVDRIKSYNFKGKFAASLIVELALHEAGHGALYAPGVVYETSKILEAIKEIENPGREGDRIKKQSSFSKPTLKGLKHKHHFQVRYIPNNILLELNRVGIDKYWFEAVAKAGLKSGQAFTSNEERERLSQIFSNTLVQGLHRERVARKALTGEWIIYADIGSVSYYLTLGSHREEDSEILRRVQNCFYEFPELKEYLDSIRI